MKRQLTLGAAVALTALVMSCVVVSIMSSRQNHDLLMALARSHVTLVSLTDKDIQMRRASAARARQTIEWCKSGMLSGPPCRDLPSEQTLAILER